MLNGLDLFSGIGGISIALRKWVRPLAYCEIDPFCQAVLLCRMADGNVEQAPIWDDIRTFDGDFFEGGVVDIITAGFPCQDISIAGAGKGLGGERSGLFFEIVRLAKEIKPSFIFLENVPAIRGRGGEEVVATITSLGYDCRWCVISAASVGASHKRERWFLLANSKGERQQEAGQPFRSESTFSLCDDESEHDLWDEEPKDKLEVDGMVNGISPRSHRIKALGNAVVPKQVEEAFKILLGV